MYNSEYFQNTNDMNVTGNNNTVNQEMDVNVNMNSNMNPSMMANNSSPVRERVVHRTFVHEVPQDCSFMIDKNREVQV